MRPTIGRIVHFHSQTVADRNPNQPGAGFNGVGEGPYPAIVTQLFTDADGNVTYCNLKVFPPFSPPFDEGSVAEKDAQFSQPNRYWVWPPRDEVKPAEARATRLAVEATTSTLRIATDILLTSGASGVQDEEKRVFHPSNLNDAVTRFAEKVTAFDQNDRVRAGYVNLRRLFEGGHEEYIAGWTKTSDERPTSEGSHFAEPKVA